MNENCELSNARQLKIPKDKMKNWKYILNIGKRVVFPILYCFSLGNTNIFIVFKYKIDYSMDVR